MSAMSALIAKLQKARSVVCISPIRCVDGLELSIQAGRHHYSLWSEDGSVPEKVEIGYPSEQVAEILPFAEDPANPTETVYKYVPLQLVAQIIAAHGGIEE